MLIAASPTAVAHASGAQGPPLPPGTLVAPVEKDCPRNTEQYPNEAFPNAEAIYSCQFVVQDNGNTGYPVIIRLGRPGPLGSGAFGLIHYTVDHNVSDEMVAAVIANNAAGLRRRDGRYVYGLRGVAFGETIYTVEVIVDRSKSVDGHDFGVVTAYCLGPTVCPEGLEESMRALYVR
ncbi:hypothetical protein GCM10009609_43600 [Pseudonocardia aurantiaca]